MKVAIENVADVTTFNSSHKKDMYSSHQLSLHSNVSHGGYPRGGGSIERHTFSNAEKGGADAG